MHVLRKPLSVVSEAHWFAVAGEGCSGFNDDKHINNIPKLVETQLQQVDLVKKREAIKNSHDVYLLAIAERTTFDRVAMDVTMAGFMATR